MRCVGLRKTQMKTRLKICLCLCLAVLMCLAACGRPASPGEDGDSTLSQQDITPDTAQDASGLKLADGLYITEVFSYTGVYVEDGSNDPCENICAVRLENGTAEHYQYLEFEVETAGGVFEFAASTLFSGARMTVLSKNKDAYTGADVRSVKLLALAPFTKTPTVHTDTLQITFADGAINVKNLTEKTLSNVYVYFKNTDGSVYLGGITYRTGFGDIPAGEIVQASASNIRKDTSRVVFADYSE